MFKRGKWFAAGCISLLAMSLIGCGTAAKNASAPGAAVSTDPVTISVYITGLAFSDTEFQHFITEPVQKKYPYITIQMVRDATGSKPQDLISSGNFPDLILTSNTSFQKFSDLAAVQPVDDLIKKQNFDLSKVKSVITDSIKLYSDKGEMLALPVSLNFAQLWYNKDIFDKFGVQYPKDGMTWDQIIQIAKQLTRNADGKQYIGIDLEAPDRIGGELSLPLVDKKTGLSVINSPEWTRVLNLEKSVYDLPGYVQGTKYTYGTTAFMKDRTLAMMNSWADAIIGPENDMYIKGDIMNWDVAQLPNFPEAIGSGREVDIHALMLSKTSQHKDQAFQVMTYILSDEVQTLISKAGRRSVLNNTALDKVFGEDLPSLQGKNIAGIFKTEPRRLHDNPTAWDKDIVKVNLSNAAKDVAINNVDINTALSNAQQKSDQQIQTAKQQQ